jgi:choline dehydrogenase
VRTYNTEINGPRIAWHALNWLLRRRGPATSPYPHAVAFFRSRPDEPHPDLQLLFGPFAFGVSEQGVVPYRHPAISCVVNACHPESHGELTLRDPNPQTAPLIRHAMFEHPEDMRRQIAGCRFARQLLAAAAFTPYATQEYLPGPGVETQEQWTQSVRSNSFLGYHPIGTCRMGQDNNAVVNPRLEVQGVSGLRVVDASVMPWHISANTNAATLMIAEKAAHMIRARH